MEFEGHESMIPKVIKGNKQSEKPEELSEPYEG